jgi:hypothetical protein
MAQRLFTQLIEDYDGLELKSSGLKGDLTTCNQATNLVSALSYSIKSRYGFQRVGQYGRFFGLFNWSYPDPITGSTVEELFGQNDRLWKLKTAVFTITRVAGSTNNSFTFLPNGTGTGDFNINQNGAISNFPVTVEPSDTYTTVYSLSQSINGLANFNTSLDPAIKFALVDTSTPPTSTVITVFAGHNYVAGDWVTYTNAQGLVKRKVVSVTATSVTVINWGTNPVTNNQVLGPYAAAASGINYTGGTAFTSSTTITFPYWDPIVDYDGTVEFPVGPWTDSKTNFGLTKWVPSTFIGTPRKLQILTSSYSKDPKYGRPYNYDGQSVQISGLPTPNFARPGLNTFEWGLSVTAGPGLTANSAYRYKIYIEQYSKLLELTEGGVSELEVDTTGVTNTGQITPNHPLLMGAENQLRINGNQVGVTTIVCSSVTGSVPTRAVQIGDTVGFFDRSVTPNRITYRTVTAVNTGGPSITISGAAVNVNTIDPISVTPVIGLNARGARINGLQSNNNLITVVTGHTIEVGDRIIFYEQNSANYFRRNVTAVTATTITYDGSAGTTDSATGPIEISTDIKFRIYRTKANGNIFYELAVSNTASYGVPRFDSPTTLFNDTSTDAQLGAQLFEPPIGYERDMPPRASTGCLHQGVMVYTGIYGEDNTVAFSDPDGGFEAVPLATNYFDVSSNQPGPIRAVVSDTEDKLSLFKSNGYYEANGDLVSLAFTVINKKEGDWGISSPVAFEKVDGVNIAAGRLGILAISNGEFQDLGQGDINPVIRSDSLNNFGSIQACNDYINMMYRIHIPPNQALNSLYYRRIYYFNYANQIWTNGMYREGTDADCGMVPYANRIYHCSKWSYTTGSSGGPGNVFAETSPDFVTRIQSSDIRAMYYDSGLQKVSRYETEWLPFGKPSVEKLFLSLKIYRLIPDYEQAYIPPTMGVSVVMHVNYDGVNALTTQTMNFTSYADFEKSVKFPSGHYRSAKFTITANGTDPVLYMTGLELLVSGPYRETEFTNDRLPSA